MDKVKIICKEHGVFEQTPNKHKRGGNCQKCAIQSMAKTKTQSTLELIENCKVIHNNIYDYSDVNYINPNIKINIICKEHGMFEQYSYIHKQGKGCPYCAYRNNYKDRPTYLYYIKIKEHYKIGITLKKTSINGIEAINKRYSTELKKGIVIDIIKVELFEDGEIAYLLEQSIIKNNKDNLIQKEDMILETGYTETFNCDVSLAY